MSLIDTPLMRGLERVLDLSAFRHQVIATNLANIDTPGFHTRDVRPFAGDIEQAMAGTDSSSGDPWSGDPAFDDSGSGGQLWNPQFMPVAHEIRGLLERPDGNNVSVERETLLLAQNQLRFQVAAQFLKAEFHRLSSAITGGSTS
jgi:flagellar basal-body rod protein FlgB